MHTALLAQPPAYSGSSPAVVRSCMAPQTQSPDTRGRWAHTRSYTLKAQLKLGVYALKILSGRLVHVVSITDSLQ